MVSKRLGLCVLALSALPACLLLTSVDGLSGGGPGISVDAGPGDVSTVLVDGSAPGPGDAGADGSADGATDAEPVDAGTFCERQDPDAAFCADFDREPVPTFGWTSFSKAPEDKLALDPNAFSPPYAATMVRGAGGCTPVQLGLNLPSFKTELHLKFRIRTGQPDGGPTTGYVGSVRLDGTKAGVNCALIFDLVNGNQLGVAIQPAGVDGGAFDFASATRYPQNGVWSLMEVDIVARDAGAGFTLNVHVDGKPAIQERTLMHCPAGGGAGMALGPSCSPAGTMVSYDDVIVQVK